MLLKENQLKVIDPCKYIKNRFFNFLNYFRIYKCATKFLALRKQKKNYKKPNNISEINFRIFVILTKISDS